jgi:hypothetical protein
MNLRSGLRLGVAVLFGAVTFLASMTSGCDATGGPSSWDRCRSWLGTPTIEWPGGDLSLVFPLLLGIAVAALLWWRLREKPPKRGR